MLGMKSVATHLNYVIDLSIITNVELWVPGVKHVATHFELDMVDLGMSAWCEICVCSLELGLVDLSIVKNVDTVSA